MSEPTQPKQTWTDRIFASLSRPLQAEIETLKASLLQTETERDEAREASTDLAEKLTNLQAQADADSKELADLKAKAGDLDTRAKDLEQKSEKIDEDVKNKVEDALPAAIAATGTPVVTKEPEGKAAESEDPEDFKSFSDRFGALSNENPTKAAKYFAKWQSKFFKK